MSNKYNLKQDLNNQTDIVNQMDTNNIKMIIIQNTNGQTAININSIDQISYAKSKKKQNTNYIVAEVNRPSYQLEMVCHNGCKYNKRYDSHDECKKMFNDLLDFIQSDNIDENTFHVTI